MSTHCVMAGVEFICLRALASSSVRACRCNLSASKQLVSVLVMSCVIACVGMTTFWNRASAEFAATQTACKQLFVATAKNATHNDLHWLDYPHADGRNSTPDLVRQTEDEFQTDYTKSLGKMNDRKCRMNQMSCTVMHISNAHIEIQSPTTLQLGLSGSTLQSEPFRYLNVDRYVTKCWNSLDFEHCQGCHVRTRGHRCDSASSAIPLVVIERFGLTSPFHHYEYIQAAWVVAMMSLPKNLTRSRIQVLSLSDNDWQDKTLSKMESLWNVVFGSPIVHADSFRAGCYRNVVIAPRCKFIFGYQYVPKCPTDVPSFVNIPSLKPHLSALRERVLTHFGLGKTMDRDFSDPLQNKVLYAPRPAKGGAGRTLTTRFSHLQHDCMLEGILVESVAFEKLSLEQQIQAAASARVLIGVEGAAFVNKLWMAPGGILVIVHVPKDGYRFPFPNRWFDNAVLGGHHVFNVVLQRPSLNTSLFCRFVSSLLLNRTYTSVTGSVTDVVINTTIEIV